MSSFHVTIDDISINQAKRRKVMWFACRSTRRSLLPPLDFKKKYVYKGELGIHIKDIRKEGNP